SARAEESAEFVFVLGPERTIVHQPVWLQVALRCPGLECASRFEKATYEARCSQVQQDHSTIAALIGPGPGVCRTPTCCSTIYEQSTGTERQKHRIKERYLQALTEAVSLPCDEGHDDGDGCGQGAKLRGERQGVEAGLILRAAPGVRAGRGSQHAFPRRHCGPRVIGGETGQ